MVIDWLIIFGSFEIRTTFLLLDLIFDTFVAPRWVPRATLGDHSKSKMEPKDVLDLMLTDLEKQSSTISHLLDVFGNRWDTFRLAC